MKKETKIYTEYCIRNQIAAGGSDDWQIRLGKYVISLQYVDCPGDGFLGRLAPLYIREIETARSMPSGKYRFQQRAPALRPTMRRF